MNLLYIIVIYFLTFLMGEGGLIGTYILKKEKEKCIVFPSWLLWLRDFPVVVGLEKNKKDDRKKIIRGKRKFKESQ